jgi:hypothetical protein
MRLVLNLPSPWTEKTPVDGEELAFARDDLPARLHTTALDDRFARARLPTPDAVRSTVVSETHAYSALGWPVQVVERIVTSTSTTWRELDVHYAFFEFGGSVVVTGPEDSIARHRDDLLAAALTGRPDWSGELAGLADFLVGV